MIRALTAAFDPKAATNGNPRPRFRQVGKRSSAQRLVPRHRSFRVNFTYSEKMRPSLKFGKQLGCLREFGKPVLLQYLIPFVPYPYKGEYINCPVCGGESQRIETRDRRLKRLQTDICMSCGLFFTNPMPLDSELDAYYRDTYRFDYQFALFKPGATHVQKKTREAARRYEALSARVDLGSPIDFLDVGCGSGELVRYFAEKGHRACGFEPGGTYSSYAAAQGTFDIRGTTWKEAMYEPESFDVITCLHVLEHLREPVAALVRIAEWLKADGVLLLETPNMQGYSLKGFERFHFAHVLGFSGENMSLAGQIAGLGVVERLAPTSILFSKATPPAELDLAGTVAKNLEDYGGGIKLSDYLRYHAKRAWTRGMRALTGKRV